MIKVLTISALALAAAAPASATTLLAYDTINGATVAPTIIDTPLSASDLTRGSGVTQNTGSDFNSRGWTETSALGAALNGDFLEWSISSTYLYSLHTLDIAYDRSPQGPVSIEIFASVDGGSYASIFADASVDASSETKQIDLEDSIVNFARINDVTFRLFGWGATSAAGTFDIETGNVGEGNQFGLSILGVVPLPAGLPLLAGGLGLLGLLRRKT